MKLEDLKPYPLEAILDSLPENLIYIKDSGAWSVREEDAETIILSQNVNDSVGDFVNAVFIDQCKKSALFSRYSQLDLASHSSSLKRNEIDKEKIEFLEGFTKFLYNKIGMKNALEFHAEFISQF